MGAQGVRCPGGIMASGSQLHAERRHLEGLAVNVREPALVRLPPLHKVLVHLPVLPARQVVGDGADVVAVAEPVIDLRVPTTSHLLPDILAVVFEQLHDDPASLRGKYALAELHLGEHLIEGDVLGPSPLPDLVHKALDELLLVLPEHALLAHDEAHVPHARNVHGSRAAIVQETRVEFPFLVPPVVGVVAGQVRVDDGKEVGIDVQKHLDLADVVCHLQGLLPVLFEKAGLGELLGKEVRGVLNEVNELPEEPVHNHHLLLVGSLPPSSCSRIKGHLAAHRGKHCACGFPALQSEGSRPDHDREDLVQPLLVAQLAQVGRADHPRHCPHEDKVVVRAIIGQLVLLELDDARFNLVRSELGVLSSFQPGRLLVRDCLLYQEVVARLVADVPVVELGARKGEQRREQPEKEDLAFVAHARVGVPQALVPRIVYERHLDEELRVELGMGLCVLHREEALHAGAAQGVRRLCVL
mmetsp:Transcript_18070/g.40805  ORF Transcript_18070/g.40805 Transcript_18070/m.40805 type:complete len:471 (+) Transcript_18070:51-1463(+)